MCSSEFTHSLLIATHPYKSHGRNYEIIIFKAEETLDLSFHVTFNNKGLVTPYTITHQTIFDGSMENPEHNETHFINKIIEIIKSDIDNNINESFR